jgi:hypothetical protein
MRDPTVSPAWTRLTVAGSVSVLISTPALLVCAGAGAGLAVAALRRDRWYLLPRVALLVVISALTFAVGYLSWYAPNASAPYMQVFWGETFLRPGAPNFLARLGLNLEDVSCTLTCWRGASHFPSVLLLLAAVGLLVLARRRGPEYAILLGGPILAAFGASMLGRYPITTRLILFSAPCFAALVATGGVAAAVRIQRSWPRIHIRWVLLLLLYPSAVVAATLAFAAPAEWGFRGEEVRPLAKIYESKGEHEPVYVFARSVPPWVFHTTDWNAPDTARLAWVARSAGPEGRGFVNGPTRGQRPLGEGADLVYSYHGRNELYGSPTGAQARMGVGYFPPQPDPGWAENEAWRMRSAARPYIWIVISDYVHGPLDEAVVLLRAVQAAGGELVFSKAAADAMLVRVRFPSHRPE